MRAPLVALVAALATTAASAGSSDTGFGEAGAVLRSAKNGTSTKAAKFDFVEAKAAALKVELGALKNKTEAAHAAKFTILDELEGIVESGAKPTPCQIKNVTRTALAAFKGRRLAQGGEAVICTGGN